jgi:hypothetical protein
MGVPVKLIGLTGRKGHGKDTVASMLVERGYTQLRFADPLKNMLRAFYATLGVPERDIERRIEGDLKEELCPFLGDKTPRQAMQTLGTEWGRGCIASDLWVVTLQRRAWQCRIKRENVVVSDVRFPNECAAIHEMGGVVYRVDAGDRVPSNEFSNHASETEVDALSVDGIIDNSGDLAQLRPIVDDVVAVTGAVHHKIA